MYAQQSQGYGAGYGGGQQQYGQQQSFSGGYGGQPQQPQQAYGQQQSMAYEQPQTPAAPANPYAQQPQQQYGQQQSMAYEQPQTPAAPANSYAQQSQQQYGQQQSMAYEQPQTPAAPANSYAQQSQQQYGQQQSMAYEQPQTPAAPANSYAQQPTAAAPANPYSQSPQQYSQQRSLAPQQSMAPEQQTPASQQMYGQQQSMAPEQPALGLQQPTESSSRYGQDSSRSAMSAGLAPVEGSSRYGQDSSRYGQDSSRSAMAPMVEEAEPPQQLPANGPAAMPAPDTTPAAPDTTPATSERDDEKKTKRYKEKSPYQAPGGFKGCQLEGHRGEWKQMMGLYDCSDGKMCHGKPLYRKARTAAGREGEYYYMFSSSLNGAWLVTDDKTDLDSNLGGLKSKSGACKSPCDPGIQFKYYDTELEDWIDDPKLIATPIDMTNRNIAKEARRKKKGSAADEDVSIHTETEHSVAVERCRLKSCRKELTEDAFVCPACEVAKYCDEDCKKADKNHFLAGQGKKSGGSVVPISECKRMKRKALKEDEGKEAKKCVVM